MSWTGDQAACGHHAEKVVHASLVRAAGDGQYVVPDQRQGHVPEVRGVNVEPGPLDSLAYVPDFGNDTFVPMVVEVKNVHDWIYPWDRRLWALLVKAAHLAEHFPAFPVLVCPYSDFTAFRMGQDCGFSRARYESQLFTPDTEKIPDDEFEAVQKEFGLLISRPEAGQPLQPLVDFFGTEPRHQVRSVELSGRHPWALVAAQRFKKLAPAVLRFSSLAGDLPPESRREVFRGFATAVRATADWPIQGGWALAGE